MVVERNFLIILHVINLCGEKRMFREKTRINPRQVAGWKVLKVIFGM